MKQKITSFILLLLCTLLLTLSYYKVNSQKLHQVFYKNKTLDLPSSITIHASDTDNFVLEPTLNGRYACLMDADTHDVLLEKSANERVPMASTTKIMTALLALTESSPEDIVTISSYAASMPDVQLGLRANEQYYMKDLLYSLMLESHNDSAVAIAEQIGQSVEGFAKRMNQKAKELGLRNTSFVTPNGLDAEGHYTTATDLALLTSHALKNDEFRTLIRTPAHSFHDMQGKRSFSVHNKDAFLTMYQGALGVKTGFTGKAGYCFVGAATQGNRTLVSVTLASGWPPHKTYKWKDTVAMMNYGMNEFEESVVSLSTLSLPSLPVHDSTIPSLSLYLTSQQPLTRKILSKREDHVELRYVLPRNLIAPVASNTIVGSLLLCKNDKILSQVPLVTGASAPSISFTYCIRKLISFFMKY